VQIVCIWSIASFKSRLVLPFWYRLAQVVLGKRLSNRCSSGSSSEVTTLWCYTNLFIVMIIIIFTPGSIDPRGYYY